MIKVSEYIKLKEVSNLDSETLYKLMKEIYPLAYSHFWIDNGNWYVNKHYAKERLLKELLEENSDNYFILFKDKIIGNFRIIWDDKLAGLTQEKQVKLHRVYLHQNTQGNGIGNELMAWLENKAKEKGYKIIWLDAMNEQPQAFQFYKKQGNKYHSHIFLPFKLLLDEVRKMSQVYKEI